MESGLTSGWHLTRLGATYGPYEWTALVALVQEGRIAPDDLVWQQQLPGWIPAQQVPGLFAAQAGVPWAAPAPGAAAYGPGAAGAPARRRRLSGMTIAAICLAAVIVLAGAGVGTWLALRGAGDGGSATNDGDGNGTVVTSGEQQMPVEDLNLGGTVVLPEGAALSPGDLVVLSNTAEASCSTEGDFAVSAVRDQKARTVVVALNGDRQPVLMAIAESNDPDLKPSVATTARALVLYDPAFLSLTETGYRSAAEALESHAGLPALESAVADAIASDPSSPLDGDAHPELYDQAAQISADILAGLIEIDESAVAAAAAYPAPVLLASTDLTALGPIALAEGSSFVDVVDDPDHATPEVRLINTTWAIYSVSWTLKTADGKTSSDHTLLPRCAPWRVDLGSAQLGWPPIGFKLEKLVNAGNGTLSFEFKRNDTAQTLGIAADFVGLVLGAGGESIRGMAMDEQKAAAILKSGGAMGQALKDLANLGERLQGQTYDAAAKEVAGFFVVNGTRIILAALPLLQQEIKEEFVTVMGKMITKKMAALAVLSYSAVDLMAQCSALGNPNIVSSTTGGLQLANIYPFKASLKLTATTKDQKTYAFQALISDMPDSLKSPTELVVDFGDGNTEKFGPEYEAGMAAISFKHTYSAQAPAKAQAVLRISGNNPTVIATAEAPLEAGPATTGINGTWRGMEKINGTDFATIEIVFDIGANGTGVAKRGAGGITAVELPASYVGGVVSVQYMDLATVVLTGQLNGPNSMTLTALVEAGTTVTWELTRQN